MQTKAEVLRKIKAALEHEARIDFQAWPIAVDLIDGLVILNGELPSLAAKKQALGAACMVHGVRGAIDELQVAQVEKIGDGAVRDAVCTLLLQDVDFRNCAIRTLVKDRPKSLREPAGERCGSIEVAVEDGVVELAGEVISLSHMRLAGVLAWWAKGVRDVINTLEVNPPEDDNDDEVTDALRLVLETDPRVHAAQIGIRTKDYVVTLEGVVPSEDERRFAEQDAWYLYAVGRVINRLEVRA